MYKPETSYEEFLMKEQEKYPDLNLIDIESLKKLVKANEELPPINSTIFNPIHFFFFDAILEYFMV